MDIKRYIEIQAFLTKTKELIPIWDERLIFEKTENYGNQISIRNTSEYGYSLVSAIFDLKSKTISMGIELNYYPQEKEIEFKKCEIIFYEINVNTFAESKIKEIVFETYELEIVKGKKMHNFYKTALEKEIEPEMLYSIKRWNPSFILENDVKIDSKYQLKHKA